MLLSSAEPFSTGLRLVTVQGRRQKAFALTASEPVSDGRPALAEALLLSSSSARSATLARHSSLSSTTSLRALFRTAHLVQLARALAARTISLVQRARLAAPTVDPAVVPTFGFRVRRCRLARLCPCTRLRTAFERLADAVRCVRSCGPTRAPLNGTRGWGTWWPRCRRALRRTKPSTCSVLSLSPPRAFASSLSSFTMIAFPIHLALPTLHSVLLYLSQARSLPRSQLRSILPFAYDYSATLWLPQPRLFCFFCCKSLFTYSVVPF
eukprot:6200480-Pleurochrysis_carterae.AAC.1